MIKNVLILEDMPDTQRWLTESCHIAFPDAGVHLANSLQVAAVVGREVEPDLALVDLHLPDGEGHLFIPELLKTSPNCICVVVTIYAEEKHLLPSLKAGAKGYILKDQSKSRIAELLNQAAIGELPLSPTIASILLNQFVASEHGEPESPLTNRESQVLALIAKGSSTPEVAEMLNISRYTAEDHLKQVYRKLNISSRAEAALEAHRLKLV